MSKRKHSKKRTQASSKPEPTRPNRSDFEETKLDDKKSEISGKMFFGVIAAFVVIAAVIGFIMLGPQNNADTIVDKDGADKGNQNLAQGEGSDDKVPPITKTGAAKKTWAELDDATSDGWQTEVFNDHANHQLKVLGKLLTENGPVDPSKFNSLIANDFECSHLQPGQLETVFEDQGVVVERAAVDPPESKLNFKGSKGFGEAIQLFRKPFENATDFRYKFKLFRVQPIEGSKNEIVTRQYLGISGQTQHGMLEQNSTWITHWRTDGELVSNKDPFLRSIRIEDFEQIRTRTADRPLFVDCTNSALEKNPSFKRQLLHGYNHWLDRTETRAYWERLGTPGVALGDANGDGMDDLYLCQEHGLPNMLLIQNADGTATDISEQAGVNWIEDCRSALFLDLDNDGDQDLIVGATGGLVLAENDGKANFKINKVLPITDDVKSICAADYDNDGRVDIYATAYYANLFKGGKVENTDVAAARANRVIYDINTGGKNTLYRNEIEEGNWAFSDITEQAGLNVHNSRYSLAATWEDFDNDGDQDLYVANDYGLNCFYRNDNGNFKEIAVETKIEDNSFAMSSAWGDYNRDGFMDLYIGNMYSAAGNRVTFQNMFKPGTTDSDRARFQHLARGNSLFKNNGDGSFDDVTIESAVNVGRWAWSTNFIDLNNDGWEDLIVANGMITTEDTGDC